MAHDASCIRLTVLCEDRQHERFMRGVLEGLGCLRTTFVVAPSGRGAAENWVAVQYAMEVRKFRSARNHQNIGLVCMRDGDRVGLVARKLELDERLQQSGYQKRQTDECIVNLVPSWSIETWLLFLSGQRSLTEDEPLKARCDALELNARELGRRAVDDWLKSAPSHSEIVSLRDARLEFDRLGFARLS